MQLFEENALLGNKFLTDFESTSSQCSSHLQSVQKILLQESTIGRIKPNVHLRVFSLPSCSELNRIVFPSNKDLELFLQITGTVIKSSIPKILEYKRAYKCGKCKNIVETEADFYQKYLLEPPKWCLNPDCKHNKFVVDNKMNTNTSKDYQEVKIQEQILYAQTGCIPNTLRVILEDDLVDSCKPGDAITVCGIVKRQFSPLVMNEKLHVETVILANHVQINNNNSLTIVKPETRQYFTCFWEYYHKTPLKGRDIIVKSFCPHIYGLHLVKLAVLITLAGGSAFQEKNDSKVKTRSEPHILLIGDPGTAKSQFLLTASKIIARSILTTGVGSTSAGLTVTAVKESNEWQLEAGALVLSDGGVCCIDEFNSMKENDRTSIHEAMEQQSISVAKAGIVCKLNTRCSILAATNPKRGWDSNHPITINTGIPSPLLSRFDLVFILRDVNDKNWDKIVSRYILNNEINDFKDENIWDLEMLQAYFVTIKKINPILNENSNKILAAYYQVQRKALIRNKSRTTVRLLDSLIRLAQAHAKLMFRDQVEVLDAIMAVILIEASIENGSVLNLELNIREKNFDDPEKDYLKVGANILEKLGLLNDLKDELDRFKIKCFDETTSFRNTGKLSRKINKSYSIIYKRNDSKSFNLNDSEGGKELNVEESKDFFVLNKDQYMDDSALFNLDDSTNKCLNNDPKTLNENDSKKNTQKSIFDSNLNDVDFDI
nr:DNA helicase MCM9-like isoform X4 [Onthophagus taurus]